MQIVNLTPHAITFVGDGKELVIKPSGSIARVAAKTVDTGSISSPEGFVIPTTATQYGEVEGLPEAKDGTIYIVSSLVASRVRERKDVFIPNESIRDDAGRIIGCRSLGHV